MRALLCALAFASLGAFAQSSTPTPVPEKPSPPQPVQTIGRSPIQQCLIIGTRLNVPSGETCDSLRDASASGKSHAGENIHRFDLGAPPEKARIRVLVIGAIHGDETSAAWLPFQWLTQVLPNANLQGQNIAVRVIPVLNPDLALAQTIKRTNARGVDLNRNFPTADWKTQSAQWWETTAKKDPRRWPGKEPASEAESKLTIKEMDQYKPNVVVAVHAPFALLDFDGNGVTPPERIGSLRLDSIGIYPGSLGNYGSMVRGIPVLTLELPHAQKATGPSEARKMWNDLTAWMTKRETLLSIQAPKS